MILVGWMGAGSKGRDASVPAITEGREVRAGMILVGSMGAGSLGCDASVHAITERGQIRPAVGTAALAGRTQRTLTMRLTLRTGCGDGHVPLHRASVSCGRGVRAGRIPIGSSGAGSVRCDVCVLQSRWWASLSSSRNCCVDESRPKGR